jgi:ABC-type transport system involved in multi-copper enzyme maturation permease subunit
MRGLLAAELRRLTARRLVRVLAAIGLLIVLVVQVRAFVVSNRDLPGAQRRAQRQAAELGPTPDALVQLCYGRQRGGELPPDVDCTTPESIERTRQEMGFATDWQSYYRDPRLSARQALPANARGVAVAGAIAAFLAGASFIGAEWHAGTMQALLFWEPRRERVLLAKALALVGGVAAYVLGLQALMWGGTMLTAATRGNTAGVTAGFQASVLLVALRGLLVVGITALLGYAIAGIARVTAAALGAAFVYFVIVENLIRGIRLGWQRYLFSENVIAILLKRIEVAPANGRTFVETSSGFGEPAKIAYLSGVRGAITIGIYLALLLGAFALSFRRRDVT